MQMVKMTKDQQKALLRVWCRDPNVESFLSLRRRVVPELFGAAVMVQWCGMWLGIEPDGYTHS
jgi:hypothetical protein